MADTNNKIKVDELNFDGIRNNLKNFLRGQTAFKDYDFDGSNLSIMVDLLAYNTYYNNIYNNLAVNEMFLDSASKRSSVVSIAKMLGYTPKSARASKANVTITVEFPLETDNPANDLFILPKYTQFTSSTSNTVYYFMNIEELTVNKNDLGEYEFANIDLYEGRATTQKFIADPTTRYVISNTNVDTTTLKVYVSPSSGTGDPVAYQLADSIVGVDNTSNVYFIKEIENEQFEITFGNGVIGKKLQSGNLVTIEYVVTSGSEPNGCKTFKGNLTSIAPGSVTTVVTNSSATNGSEVEDVASIKFNAPRAYFTQDRAVTEDDFRNIIYANFANAQSVNIWGGEENDPPVYGKVYLCIKPKNALYLTEDEKSVLKNEVLKPKSIVTMTPEIVDPSYLNIQINTVIYYNPKMTNLSASTLIGQVKDTIVNYKNSDLQKFDGVFRQSKLSRLIDASNSAIQSNITTITLRREVTPKYNLNAQYIVNIGNPIYYSGVPEESFVSTGFNIPNSDAVYYLRDDGTSKVVMYYVSGVQEVVVNNNIGIIDYSKGIITINGLNIVGVQNDILEFIVKPQSYDVVALRNQILDIPTSMITVSALVDPISSGNPRGGSAYVFTSSRS